MINMTTELIAINARRNRRGHRLISREQRAAVVQAWCDSGLSMAAFARRERIAYSSFAAWALKSARADKRPSPRSPHFAEVRVAPALPIAPLPSARLEVRLPDGTELRGAHAAELATLVRALRA